MADDKNGRDQQADDAEKRQRERDVATQMERRERKETSVEPEALADLETELESIEFPATGAEIVSRVGDREVQSVDGTYALADLLPETEDERYDSPDAVRVRIERPTIAAAMKRVVEASQTLPNVNLYGSQRDAYEKTFEELEAIDADDDDEGIRVMSDWIVERIHEKERLPGSRAVRRQAAKFCRANGYQVRDDEWLGI